MNFEDANQLLQFDPPAVVIHQAKNVETLEQLGSFASTLTQHVETAIWVIANEGENNNNGVKEEEGVPDVVASGPEVSTEISMDFEDANQLLQFDPAAAVNHQAKNVETLEKLGSFASTLTRYVDVAMGANANEGGNNNNSGNNSNGKKEEEGVASGPGATEMAMDFEDANQLLQYDPASAVIHQAENAETLEKLVFFASTLTHYAEMAMGAIAKEGESNNNNIVKEEEGAHPDVVASGGPEAPEIAPEIKTEPIQNEVEDSRSTSTQPTSTQQVGGLEDPMRDPEIEKEQDKAIDTTHSQKGNECAERKDFNGSFSGGPGQDGNQGMPATKGHPDNGAGKGNGTFAARKPPPPKEDNEEHPTKKTAATTAPMEEKASAQPESFAGHPDGAGKGNGTCQTCGTRKRPPPDEDNKVERPTKKKAAATTTAPMEENGSAAPPESFAADPTNNNAELGAPLIGDSSAAPPAKAPAAKKPPRKYTPAQAKRMVEQRKLKRHAAKAAKVAAEQAEKEEKEAKRLHTNKLATERRQRKKMEKTRLEAKNAPLEPWGKKADNQGEPMD